MTPSTSEIKFHRSAMVFFTGGVFTAGATEISAAESRGPVQRFKKLFKRKPKPVPAEVMP